MSDLKSFSQDFCKRYPHFVTFWKAETSYEPEEFLERFERNSPLLWQEAMRLFATYTKINYTSMSEIDLSTTFAYIENNLIASDEHLGTCLTTGFLEGIYNRVPNKLPPTIMKYFGPVSKAYCIALDDFWKTKTPGLYDFDVK